MVPRRTEERRSTIGGFERAVADSEPNRNIDSGVNAPSITPRIARSLARERERGGGKKESCSLVSSFLAGNSRTRDKHSGSDMDRAPKRESTAASADRICLAFAASGVDDPAGKRRIPDRMCDSRGNAIKILYLEAGNAQPARCR